MSTIQDVGLHRERSMRGGYRVGIRLSSPYLSCICLPLPATSVFFLLISPCCFFFPVPLPSHNTFPPNRLLYFFTSVGLASPSFWPLSALPSGPFLSAASLRLSLSPHTASTQINDIKAHLIFYTYTHLHAHSDARSNGSLTPS